MSLTSWSPAGLPSRHPPHRQSRRHLAAVDPGVVPRRAEFSGFALSIKDFQKRGVQLQFEMGARTNTAQHHHAWVVFDYALPAGHPPALLYG
jgi:hypothetical protein